MSGSSTPTKDWLKNQLVTHGVPLPASSAKKEEYQRLYDEQVKPQLNNAEFSSDDDEAEADTQPAGSQEGVSKVERWVQTLKDQNLFDALKANGKNPGPIVATTRDFYEKMFLELITDRESYIAALAKISVFLQQNPEASAMWTQDNMPIDELFTNGVSDEAVANGNGNSENGYSDTDEDELLETSSRASRSSRASSRRTPVSSRTPGRTPAGGNNVAVHRSAAGTNITLKHQLSQQRNEMESNEEENAEGSRPEPASPFRIQRPPADTLYFRGRVATSQVSSNSTASMSMRDVSYERVDDRLLSPRVAAARRRTTIVDVLKYILLLISIIAVPMLGFYISTLFTDDNGNPRVDTTPEGQQDDLDKILETLNDQDGA